MSVHHKRVWTNIQNLGQLFSIGYLYDKTMHSGRDSFFIAQSLWKKYQTEKNTCKNPSISTKTISTAILGLSFKGHLPKSEMHEWKKDYIFCFNSELPQNEAKNLITLDYGTGYIRLCYALWFSPTVQCLSMKIISLKYYMWWTDILFTNEFSKKCSMFKMRKYILHGSIFYEDPCWKS